MGWQQETRLLGGENGDRAEGSLGEVVGRTGVNTGRGGEPEGSSGKGLGVKAAARSEAF